MANDANIPIMAFTNAIGDNESGEYAGLVTYVGQNEVETGKLTGEMAKKLFTDLRKQGCSTSSELIRQFSVNNGWEPCRAEELAQFASKYIE